MNAGLAPTFPTAGPYRVGGIELERLADRVGSTPFFAYDRARLSDRIELLRSTLPEEIELGYAVKANPMPAVVQHLSGLVDRLDVASGVRDPGCTRHPDAPGQVSFAGPGKASRGARAGGAAGGHHRGGVRDGGGPRDRDRRAARDPAPRRRPGQPRLQGQGIPECGWAAARSSSASTPSWSRACSDTWPRPTSRSWGSTSSPAPRT